YRAATTSGSGTGEVRSTEWISRVRLRSRQRGGVGPLKIGGARCSRLGDLREVVDRTGPGDAATVHHRDVITARTDVLDQVRAQQDTCLVAFGDAFDDVTERDALHRVKAHGRF